MTILDRLRRIAAAHPARTALTIGARHLTFADLEGGSNAAARILRSHGANRGERVVLHAGTSIEYILAYLGALKLGAICVPANPGYRSAELGWILEDSEPVVVLADREGVGNVHLSAFYQAVQKASVTPVDEIVTADDLALLVYTSGTTGRSKGAMLTHRNLVANIDSLMSAFRWTDEDRLLHVLPLFHVHGLCVGLHGILATGCEALLLPRFDATEVLTLLEKWPATLMLGVPTMYSRMLAAVGAESRSLPAMRLFVSGSAPLSPATAEQFHRSFGHEILERYGMTETLITLAQPYDGPRQPGAVGNPVAGVRARIVDSSLRDVPDGQEGELLVRGECVGPGYWNDDAATQAVHVEGWFRTGDIACRDPEHGLLAIVGRAGDLIITGGYNVYPREIEDLLTSHPEVTEAVVHAVPDDDLGEAVAATIVPAPGASPSAEQLIAFCQERLAWFKKPRFIRLVEALPRNAMGKVLKSELEP